MFTYINLRLSFLKLKISYLALCGMVLISGGASEFTSKAEFTLSAKFLFSKEFSCLKR